MAAALGFVAYVEDSATTDPASWGSYNVLIHSSGGDTSPMEDSAYRSALALADRHGLKSIALPAISTGVYGFPVDRCARITLTEIHRYLQGGTKLERVVVCLFGDDSFKTFRQELRRGFR